METVSCVSCSLTVQSLAQLSHPADPVGVSNTNIRIRRSSRVVSSCSKLVKHEAALKLRG